MRKNYTPSPWFSVNYGGYIHLQSTNFYENTDILDEDKCPQAEANAQLASTAPELLEALQEIIKIQELDKDSLEYRNAISAINKATS